jgi:hypothetical protein
MRTLTLYKEDLNPRSILTWDGILEDLGIDTHVLVNGRYIDRELDAVTITVAQAEGDYA